MRSDMGKVVIERPRYRHSKCYGEVRNKKDTLKSRLKRLKIGDLHDDDFDDWFESITLGGVEPMKLSYGSDIKEFSDVLGPIYKYLESKVGCKWDDVWSEVCQNLRGGIAIEHVREHVKDYVTCFYDDITYLSSIEEIKYAHSEGSIAFYVGEDRILRKQIVRPRVKFEYKTIDSIFLGRKEGELIWKKMTNTKDDGYRYFEDAQGNEFIFVHNSWFIFEYGNLKDFSENSGEVSSFWEGNCKPGDENFTGVRIIKYYQYDICGNKTAKYVYGNESRNIKFRWKLRQANHAELKKAGLYVSI